MNTILERIEQIIIGLGFDPKKEDFYMDMDSLSYINAIVGIETEFSITLPDDAMAENIFISMDACVALVESLVADKENNA